MAGEGRESKKDNDLFYTCSLIDYIARKTRPEEKDVRIYLTGCIGAIRICTILLHYNCSRIIIDIFFILLILRILQ